MKTLSFLRDRIFVTFNHEKRGFDVSIVRSVKYQHCNTPYKYFVGLNDYRFLYSACQRVVKVSCRSYHPNCKVYGYNERRAYEIICNNFYIREFL